MFCSKSILFFLIIIYTISPVIFTDSINGTEKFDIDILKNYSEFFNFGVKKAIFDKTKKENLIIKSKIDVLGDVFKTNIATIKARICLDIVFLIDSSSSVGENNFKSELNFVRKFLSDVTVEYNYSRIAIVTFSSSDSIITHIDELSNPQEDNNKCLLLNTQFKNIPYSGGSTHTAKAFERAQEILKHSRNDSTKVIFLITDGFSNGDDPIPIARALKQQKVVIFTIGIQNGNYIELYELSTGPGELYSFLLDSFQEFEGLARRALHVDLKSGDYIPLGSNRFCGELCPDGDCCDGNALCACGTTTGQYSCVCQLGYYGSGLKNNCLPCPSGSYAEGPNLCLPCPDAQHVTTIPATSINDCKCKSGYQYTKDNKCEVITCESLEEPENGYFVKRKNCSNVLNSACGVRCNVGYTLTGSSIRLCQNNSKWSGIPPLCQVKTCDRLMKPENGEMACKHPDLDITYEDDSPLPVDTVCSFSCDSGRILVGSKHRTCLPLAQWDGLRSSCRNVKCNKLYKIPFGNIEPESCMLGKQLYGQVCNVSCLPGFKQHGLAQRNCTGKLADWTSIVPVICQDVTPPELNCPDNQEIETLKGKHFGNTNWTLPNVTDNSGLQVNVWTKPAIQNLEKFKFKLGVTNITYFAVDASHNKVKCTFQVTTLDKEIPTIENCNDPPTFLASDRSGANITWDEPVIYDNTFNNTLKIIKSHNFGFFNIGTTQVSYYVTDSSNNSNSCILNITVEENKCPILIDPTYGKSNCQNKNESVQCIVTCYDGYAIPMNVPFDADVDNSSMQFTCYNNNPSWEFADQSVDCSVTEVPLEILQKGEVVIEATDECDDSQKLEEFENEIKTSITSSVSDECAGIVCKIETSSDCFEDLKEVEEEESNIIKRDTGPTKKKLGKKRRKKLKVRFQLHAKNKKNKKNQKIGNINKKLKNIQYAAGRNITAVINMDEPIVNCPLGSIPRKLNCVQCPQGTFHNISAKICQSCSIGYYNERSGKTTCSSCPENFSTRRIHARSKEYCLEECSPGTFARKKQIRNPKHSPNSLIERVTLKPFCSSCPFGTYQGKYGQIICLPCLEGHTTEFRGAQSKALCVPILAENCNITNVCNNGDCAEENGYFTCVCRQNYIGTHCDKKMRYCDSIPCLNNGVCSEIENGFTCTCLEGYSGETCNIVEDTCQLKCENSGYCLQLDDNEKFCVCPEGFSGPQCETKIKYCQEGLCENNSTCIEKTSRFHCSCKNGYIGKRCTILPCDYKPCVENSVCYNVNESTPSSSSFFCECNDGYEGPKCTDKINYCLSNPCQNEGNCINLLTSYSCNCKVLFYGSNCELQRDNDYVLNFPRSGTTDYVQLEGFKDNLLEVTVCFWIKTNDAINYGTVLSYATRQFDNAFTITDYTGLVVYINNNYIISDIFLNDGVWHHFCVSWSNMNGTYIIYVDGKIAQSGINLGNNDVIQGGGKLILGQEQDILGGRFSQSESFVGRLTNLDIWSKVLLHSEILDIMNSCDFYLHGDLYSWSQIKSAIKGDVIVENSTFCKQCNDPEILYNGIIDIVENVAYYKCYKGYELNEPKYLLGRKCLKSGRWLGDVVPYCQKIYCGYPNLIKNGNFFGTNYYYKGSVMYICQDGFNMSGSKIRTCSENGEWIPEAPVCKGIQCVEISKPQHGYLKFISESSDEISDFEIYEPGTQMELICNENSDLVGNQLLSCLDSGQWDKEIGSCELKPTPAPKLACSLDVLPKAPEYGYMIQESLNGVLEGTSINVMYKCRLGYRLLGENKTVCTEDGYWSDLVTKCIPISCGKPPKLNLMVISYQSNSTVYFAGNMASYQCIEGFLLYGSGNIRCLFNGRWTKMGGKCIKQSCNKPNVVEGTEIIASSYLYQDKIIVKCGGENISLVCGSKGDWIVDSNSAVKEVSGLKCWKN